MRALRGGSSARGIFTRWSAEPPEEPQGVGRSATRTVVARVGRCDGDRFVPHARHDFGADEFDSHQTTK